MRWRASRASCAALFLSGKGRRTVSTSRSGMIASCRRRPLFQRIEEAFDLLAHLASPADPRPVQSDQADQAIAFIYWDQEAVARFPATVNQQRLDIRLHPLQYRILLRELFPGIQRQKLFRPPHRAGIEGGHSFCGGIITEEGHIDRNPQAFP